jgi:hypothetical protein
MFHHLEVMRPCYPEATQLIWESSYVDDLLSGGIDGDSVAHIQTQISELMEKRGFHFTKWISNSASIMESISHSERADYTPMIMAKKTLTITPEKIPMALGLMWDPATDFFQFQGALDMMMTDSTETMRSLLSRVAKIFDPLGLISLFIVLAKMLLQECWTQQLDWDEPLPANIGEPWERFVEEITYLHYLDIPHCMFLPKWKIVQLHAFSDASEKVGVGCIYVGLVDKTGIILVRLA